MKMHSGIWPGASREGGNKSQEGEELGKKIVRRSEVSDRLRHR
jgi:hypothetical protein